MAFGATASRGIWQALQQLEFIFNATLSVDGKNTALAKMTKHKGLSRVDAEVSMEPAREPAQNAFDMEEAGGVYDEDDVPHEQVGAVGLLPSNM